MNPLDKARSLLKFENPPESVSGKTKLVKVDIGKVIKKMLRNKNTNR